MTAQAAKSLVDWIIEQNVCVICGWELCFTWEPYEEHCDFCGWVCDGAQDASSCPHCRVFDPIALRQDGP